MSLLISKALNNLAPNYICSKINMARNSHFHNTREEQQKIISALVVIFSGFKFGLCGLNPDYPN